MNEYVLSELGFFTENTCRKIKEIMDGKTYMGFEVAWSNCAGNCTLIIKTDYIDYQDNDTKNFFLNALLSEMANRL